MAQEWMTSFEPQITCIGMSEGRVIPLVTLSLLEALMSLLTGTYPWRGRAPRSKLPRVENSRVAKVSTKGLSLSLPPMLWSPKEEAPLLSRRALLVSSTALRPLSLSGVNWVEELAKGFVRG